MQLTGFSKKDSPASNSSRGKLKSASEFINPNVTEIAVKPCILYKVFN